MKFAYGPDGGYVLSLGPAVGPGLTSPRSGTTPPAGPLLAALQAMNQIPGVSVSTSADGTQSLAISPATAQAILSCGQGTGNALALSPSTLQQAMLAAEQTLRAAGIVVTVPAAATGASATSESKIPSAPAATIASKATADGRTRWSKQQEQLGAALLMGASF
jgi:hypothetical protein